MKKLLIFDLDGTLINTLFDLQSAVNYALKQYDLPLRSIDQVRQDIGNGVSKLMERSIPQEFQYLHPTLLKIFKEYYKNHYADKTLPYEGMKETLLSLKDMGYHLGVVTNKFQEGATGLINLFYEGIFEMVQGEVDYLKRKPDPEMVEKIIDTLGYQKSESIYIGDTEVDYQTAYNSKIDVIMVTYGYRSKEFILDKLKDVPYVDTPNQLIDLLSK